MIYFIADTHFGHENIIKHTKRPFENIKQMDEKIIENWNKKVKPEDEIYIIGDFSWYPEGEKNNEILKKLNGKKYLIKGNHDHFLKNKNFNKSNFVWIKEYFVLRYKNEKIILFHYPIEEWDGFYRKSIHIHGHQHNTPDYNLKQKKLNLRRYDAGVDANNFTPVSIEEILKFTKNLTNIK